MELVFNVLTYVVIWAVETVFLLPALLIMVRIQKLQYHVPGLAISAAIACALDLIPFVGHYIALAVLWVCLTKVTREDFTGVVFTAAISYALVFGMNLFLLGALMGDLRVSARATRLPTEALDAQLTSQREADSLRETDALEPRPSTPAVPDLLQVACPTRSQAVPPNPAAVPPQTGVAALPTAAAPEKSQVAKAFSLGGVILNGKSSSARVSTGVRTYTLMLGETIFVETNEGAKSVRLDQVDSGSAWIELAGEKVKLVKAPAP